MTVTNPPQIIAGLTRGGMVRSWARMGFRRGAEIGVRQGAFSLLMCQTIPRVELLCVDPWVNYTKRMPAYSQERNYQIAVERLRPYRATLIRQTSAEVAPRVPLGSLDFVYIDGNHAYAYVREDLALWAARVRPGGVVSGDDYDMPGVQRAVHEHAESCGIRDVFLTGDALRRNRKGDIFRSWWWVQP